MKQFLFVFFLFPFLISAPLSTEELDGHYTKWSAGVCCKTGINYELSFTVKEKKAEKLIIDSICYNGHVFKRLQTKRNINDEIMKYEIKFSYSQDNEEHKNEQNSQAHEVSKSPVLRSCSKQSLHYRYRGKSFTVDLPVFKIIKDLPEP